jgi:hypothetical protein
MMQSPVSHRSAMQRASVFNCRAVVLRSSEFDHQRNIQRDEEHRAKLRCDEHFFVFAGKLEMESIQRRLPG